MKNKKVTKNLVTLVGAVCLSLSVLMSPISTIPVQAASEETTIQPLSDKKEWRWKVENNKLYKRLYNYSTGSWEGDWIYVRDWDGLPDLG